MAHMLWFFFLLLAGSAFGDDAGSPPLIKPSSQDTWTVGQRETVKWSIQDIDVYDLSLRPVVGSLFLGRLISTNEQYLWFDTPLATNFTFISQQVDVIVPAVPSAHSYYVVLVGRSTNRGPIFSINNPADPQGTGNISTSFSVVTATPTTSTTSTSAPITPPPSASTTSSSSSSSTNPSGSASNGNGAGRNAVSLGISVAFGLSLVAMFA